MSRLFAAIDLPEDIRHHVYGLREDLQGFRWVPIEQLHLTLRFIGDCNEPTVEFFKKSLADIHFSSFGLELKGIGHFPLRGMPRVLWAGIASGTALFSLQASVERVCIAAGLVPEERRFSPHLTLARLKEPSPATVMQFEARHAGFCAGPISITTFHLYASTLTQKGALHRKIATIESS
jgi:2'-5' RNA ligase